MYRLLKFKPRQSNSLAGLSLSTESIGPEKSCFFCKILQSYSYAPARCQSTIVNPNPVLSQKVRKKRAKRFHTTELLEVSNKSTLQHTTKIQTVNASDFQKLLETNEELSKLYKIKSVSPDVSHLEEHTYNNLTVINHDNDGEITNFTEVQQSDQRIISMLGFSNLFNPNLNPRIIEDLDDRDIFKDDEHIEDNIEVVIPEGLRIDSTNDILDNIPRINSSFQPETLEDISESHEEETHEEKITVNHNERIINKVNLKAKREMIVRTLAAYIEVCSVQKLTNRGFGAFMFYDTQADKKHGTVIDDINVFNTLLKSYKNKGNIKILYEILRLMEKNKVEHNLQTYITILDYLIVTFNKNQRNIDRIKKFCTEALNKGFTFDKMMNEGIFAKDERENVLEAMRIFDPTYQPKFATPIVQYKNELVDDLNHRDQLKMPKLKTSESSGLFSCADMKIRVAYQLDLERQHSITVSNVEATGKPSEKVVKYRKSLEELYEAWTETATKAFNRDLHSLSYNRSSTNPDVYMRCIPAKDFITIIVDEAKKLAQGSESYSPTVNMLHRDLGVKVYERYKVLRKEATGVIDKTILIHGDYCARYAASHKKLEVLPTSMDNLNGRQNWQWIEYKRKPTGATLIMDHNEWVPTVLTEIGKFLYHIIMHDLMVDVNSMKLHTKNKKYLPAFYNIFRNQGRIVKEEVKPHPVLSQLYKSSIPETLTFPVSEVPMVCPPVPWTSAKNGGYVITASPVIRLPDYALAQKQKIEAGNVQNLYPCLDSLNQLASVPWKVNTKVLDVILEVFNSGGSDKLDVPQPPDSLPPVLAPGPMKELDKVQRYNYFRQKLQHRKQKAEMYSLRCDCLYRLSLAHHFRDTIFWLPHNMDFRGRVYPIPPHLNHLGSDLARSMLVFAEPRPLGPEGLDWLKIHLINLTGLMKRDGIADRLRYANECMDLIFDSADHPLDGKKWWADSEEPWQTLACCIEIAAAVRSGDPENFKSHFPVHQDGSCNGLQHYAALGRDKIGGYSVNLCPAPVPQDVYMAVVKLVEEKRREDAENGIEIAQHLEGFIKRKVIKQTIMTTVYGVTRFGARLQIAKQLKDIENFPKDQVFAASNYLTSKTFESLRTMFTSTKEIQDWFTECARLISSVAGYHVEWVTPLGLPIVQPYFRWARKSANSVYEPYVIDKYEKPNVMKHKNAFPPNFIHSLDSCHMMLTSLNCERAGLTFVSVHDCFWTHPSTVPIMNKICREQFVALHSQPILEDLSLYLNKHYECGKVDFIASGSVKDMKKKKVSNTLPLQPHTGDLDITQVLNSVYFFS